MITVSVQPRSAVGIKGTETIAGRAYRLAYTEGSQQCVGCIYICTYGNQLLNLTTAALRSPRHIERYVEVDLDILVKEKS